MPDEEPNTTEEMTARQAYNLATDLATGPNIRVKDNLFQAVAILVGVIIGAALGALLLDTFLLDDRRIGAIVGGFAGLVIGLFASGLFLMIFRMIRHRRGQHD